MTTKKFEGISRLTLALILVVLVASLAVNVYTFFPRDLSQQAAQALKPAPTLQKVKVSGNNPSFDGYFLVIDAGKDRGIWAANGLDPEFVPGVFRTGFKSGAVNAADFKDLIASEIKMGFVVPSEVLLARSRGVPVKIVAGHASYQLPTANFRPL